MSVRGRRRSLRAWLPAALAILALTVVGPASVLAAAPVSNHALTPAQLKPDPIPEPRVQKPGTAAGFRLPFAAGQEVEILQAWNTKYSHNGKSAYAYDFGLLYGTDVLAAAPGVVAFVHDGEKACGGPELRNKANYVTIYHGDGSATQYGHLSTVGVKVGDVVATGQVIGKSGDTGYTECRAHLHFARQYQGGGVTQSIPTYFEGYADQEFRYGELVTQPADPCTAPSDDPAAVSQPVFGGFCGAYTGGAADYQTTFVRRDAFLNFDWQAHGPGGYWLDDASAGFSARWSGDFMFTSTRLYTVAVVSSGPVTVSIDGQPIVDRTASQGTPGEIVLSRMITSGVHRIDVSYQSVGGHGVLKLGWGLLLADDLQGDI